MKSLSHLILIVALPMLALNVHAQSSTSPPISKEDAKQKRHAEGVEAARNFRPGEGHGDGYPASEPRAKVSKSERTAARAARKREGAIAAKNSVPGDGNPQPVTTFQPPRKERRAARATQRAEVQKANKAGKIPSYGEN